MAVAQAQVRRISPRRRLTNTVLLGLCGLAGLGSAAIVLVGVPSIVVGMFGYTLIVLRDGNFSALAGAFALGFIILPIVGRTTEESLRLVPGDLREAALALGVPRWKTTLRVVLPAASTGVVTGAMLGLSRVAGETAPLLFTALGNNFWNLDPTRP